ncbi:MAG: hypothetical protein KDA28_08315 [Phycisphaerales bacterium]|nr:hypothetical protein [Phycisphaerales bacterium]
MTVKPTRIERAENAQPADPPSSATLPEAASLFAKYVEAIGGEENIDAHVSRRYRGTIEVWPWNPGEPMHSDGTPLARGTLNMLMKSPNLLRLKIVVPGQGSREMVYDGEIGWDQTVNGYALVQGSTLRDLVDTADFKGEANYATRYASIETMGEVSFQDQHAYRVKATTPAGREIQIFFDSQTSLILGTQSSQAQPNGQDIILVSIWSDYEDVDGVQYPTKIVQLVPGNRRVIEYKRIEANVVDPFRFDRPDEVTALLERDASGG